MREPNIDELRTVLAEHIAGAYVSGDGQQVARAKELEVAVDNAGLVDIENRVDRLILAQMRRRPSDRGVEGRLDNCPF
ncbi:hypothetical protein [Kitasatospora sp. NPDC057223]|uniref:hypothetical protein n=1 Tax=Kitasatospora sp. NPDC057223 TaxID=3346055 RepID=UPI0036430771